MLCVQTQKKGQIFTKIENWVLMKIGINKKMNIIKNFGSVITWVKCIYRVIV